MFEEVKEVSGITGISTTATRILLNHHKWDREQLLERIYSEDNKLEDLVPSVNQNTTEDMFWSLDECEICYSDRRKKMLRLSCGHQFCRDCWVEHINTRISHQRGSQLIECPASCRVVVDDETVLKLLEEGSPRQRYQQFVTAGYVQSNPRLRWCSGLDCSLAISVSEVVREGGEMAVTCLAGHTSCFSCGLEPHQPVSCRLLSQWSRKCQDDSETNNWVVVNTKQCPKVGHLTISHQSSTN